VLIDVKTEPLIDLAVKPKTALRLRWPASWLRWGEALRVAGGAILANRLRSGLTVAGVVVGVAVVVLVASLLQGAQEFITSQTASFAPDVARVEKAAFQDFAGDGQAFAEARAKRPDLLPDDIEYLRGRLGDRLEIGAQTDASLPVRRNGRTLRGIAVQGVTTNITSLTNVKVQYGREFTAGDNEFRRPVCIVGADIVEELFAGGNALGQELRIGQLPYQIVGVAEPRGSLFGNSQDGFVMLPLGTFTRIFGERSRSLALLTRGRAGVGREEAEELTRNALRLRRKLDYAAEDNFSIVTAKSAQAFTAKLTGIVGAIIYPLTAIALAVGGVVVMNMMLASVTERTREIGIRLALGARRGDILTQFLIEATLLTVIGGLLGLMLAGVLVWLLKILTKLPLGVPLWAVGAALIVSTAVGLIFGVVPARRASKLDPIEALRAE
jgi:putative ABC transport system permease protein